MSDAPRWVIVLVVMLLAVGLIAFARGRDHRRGDEVGALGTWVSVVQTVEA
ncbi:MAG TPA: hypothetical protein VFK59_09375 [Actinomycetota bacterium]|nr:hypothetical protein [Actinomycetota bacterium]